VRLVVALALATCIVVARPMRAQSAADSAAVLSLAVDQLLSVDSAFARPAAGQPAPAVPPVERPRLFVRIGTMPDGAWSAPSIGRLRAHRWYFNGMATDSAPAIADRDKPRRTTPPLFPAVLSLRLTFTGDSAHVHETFDMDTCEKHNGMKGVIFTTYNMVREGSAWRLSDSGAGGIADVVCTWPR
jgi:hypothetical protein